jgi:hypothetical protein
MRDGGIAPHILNIATRWRLVVSLTPWQLYTLKIIPVPNVQHPRTEMVSAEKKDVCVNTYKEF